jgi:hypothetical protein
VDTSSAALTQGIRVASAVFEQSGDGYVYFPFLWSQGYPVTTAERQDYIENFSPSYAGAFRARVCSRTPVRPLRLSGIWRNLDALSPGSSAAAAAALLIPTVIAAVDARDPVWRALLILGAALEAMVALKLVLRRLNGPGSNKAPPS